ncbi:hypothetical protein [Cystobacter ferrugineus]|uniref:hypothetical protein n=1 Tax=Cystobacter ferrugineus TaxID=83449 RepID=UPI000AF455A0|nr:hypothetical protein [Cystobacter ferrugineus]
MLDDDAAVGQLHQARLGHKELARNTSAAVLFMGSILSGPVIISRSWGHLSTFEKGFISRERELQMMRKKQQDERFPLIDDSWISGPKYKYGLTVQNQQSGDAT